LALQPLNSRVFAGTNMPFGEVWFFFPSSSGNGECDSYLKWRPVDGPAGWDYGLAPAGGGIARAAWLGVGVFGMPLAADFGPNVQQHETALDDNGSAMSGVFIQSGYFDLEDGDQVPLVKQMIPDVKWTGTGGSLMVTIWVQNESSDTPIM